MNNNNINTLASVLGTYTCEIQYSPTIAVETYWSKNHEVIQSQLPVDIKVLLDGETHYVAHITEVEVKRLLEIIFSDNSEESMSILAVTTGFAIYLKDSMSLSAYWVGLDIAYTLLSTLALPSIYIDLESKFRTLDNYATLIVSTLEVTDQRPRNWVRKGDTYINGGYRSFDTNFFTRKSIRSKINIKAVNKMQKVALTYKPLPTKLQKNALDIKMKFSLETNTPYYQVYHCDGCRTYPHGYQFNTMGDDYRKAQSLNLHHGKKLTADGHYWIKIAIANARGLDKLSWKERTQWVNSNINTLHKKRKVDEPAMYYKLVDEYSKHISTDKWTSMVGIDMTFSGGQIMALLSRCLKTAYHTNLTGDTRNDAYTTHNSILSSMTGKEYERKITKYLVMPHFYWSVKGPKKFFGKDYQLFLSSLKKMMPGATMVMDQLIDIALIARKEKRQYVKILDGVLDFDTQVLRNVKYKHEGLGIYLNHNFYIDDINETYRGLVARVN